MIPLQPAFVLHSRPYRETSALLTLFTEQAGVAAAVARGARRPKSAWQSLLQPFSPLLAALSGRGSLFTLTQAEAHGLPYRLQGDFLLSAFYINELLVKLLPEGVAMPALFELYRQCLMGLMQKCPLEPWLRSFEKRLLAALGYGLLLTQDTAGAPIQANAWYRFDAEQGASLLQPQELAFAVPDNLFTGKSLLALHQEDWSEPATLSDAKRLMRKALARQLGGKALHTRQLFFGKISTQLED